MNQPCVRLEPNTLDETRAWIAQMDPKDREQVSPVWLARVEDGSADWWTLGFRIVDDATGEQVGVCGFKHPPRDGVVEISYGVAPEHQNRGYATAAAEEMRRLAVESGRVELVIAHTLSNTNASARVLSKAGFRLVGQVDDPEDGPVWRWERLPERT